MTDAKSRGEVRNRTRRDFWCLVSDNAGERPWAFKLLAGQKTNPFKNDVDFCKPVDSGLLMQGRANQWWKVRGCPIVLTELGSRAAITELGAVIAGLSRLKDSQDFRGDRDIETEWRATINYLGGRNVSDANCQLFDSSFTSPPVGSAPAAPAPAVGPAGRPYTVQPGDWLSKIAMRPDVLKDALLWPLIHEHAQNKTVIGEDPNKLKPGMVILLPELKSFTQTQIDVARQKGRHWRK